MNWLNINSMEELQSLGKFREVSKLVKDDVGNMGKINCRGWQTLFDSILLFKDSISKFANELNENTMNPDEYFTSKANEYIFYLLELDGEVRMNKLCITKRHFTNKRFARQWMLAISKEIHPDVCKNSNAAEAMSKLNSIYDGMVGNGRKGK